MRRKKRKQIRKRQRKQTRKRTVRQRKKKPVVRWKGALFLLLLTIILSISVSTNLFGIVTRFTGMATHALTGDDSIGEQENHQKGEDEAFEEMEHKIAVYKRQLKELEIQLNDPTRAAEIASLQGYVNYLQSSLNSMKMQIAEMQGERAEQIQQSLNEMNAEVMTRATEMSSSFEAYKSEMAKMQRKLPDSYKELTNEQKIENMFRYWKPTQESGTTANTTTTDSSPGVRTATSIGVTVTIQSPWTVYYEDHTNNITSLWMNNEILFSNDDVFPNLTRQQFTSTSALATNAILVTTISSAKMSEIKSHFSTPAAWSTALDEHSQGYFIYCKGSCAQILILGTTPQAALYGVIDFTRSMSSRSATSATWSAKKVLNWPDIEKRMVHEFINSGTNANEYTAFNKPTIQEIADADTNIKEMIDAMVWLHATHLMHYALFEYNLASKANLKSGLTSFVSYLNARHINYIPSILGMHGSTTTDFNVSWAEGLGVFDEQFTITVNTTKGTIVNSSLSSTLYNTDDKINVTVYAYDGTDNSTLNKSTTITVS